MRVSHLDVFGFKSFYNKTSIHFGDGITGIVGPNESLANEAANGGRELQLILCGSQTIEDEHIQVEPGAAPAAGGPIRPLHEMEREHIVTALQAARGKVSGKGGAAELLDLKPTTLEAKMKKLNISRDLS